MKILVLIPARGGSKRLPRKNIRILGKKPVVAWSIDVCRGLPEIVDVLLSTDDEETAEIGTRAGALVPWLRPAELSTDTARTADVALHALDWYETKKGIVDAILLLQPTSPFRSRATMKRGIELFKHHGNRPVVAISPASCHPMWCLEVDGDKVRPFIKNNGFHMRSQELPSAFVVNGAFYLITPQDLRRHQSFYSEDMVPLKMLSPDESLDIDTDYDWKIAQALIA